VAEKVIANPVLVVAVGVYVVPPTDAPGLVLEVKTGFDVPGVETTCSVGSAAK
jgi:hypothetical protein